MPELETIARALANAAGINPDAIAVAGFPAMFVGGYLMPVAADQVPAWQLFTAPAQAVLNAITPPATAGTTEATTVTH